MPSKSVLRRKAVSQSSISVPDPRAYRAILATHDKRVRWLEETSIREMFSHSPAWRARQELEEALESHQTEGPSGDERQDRLLDALLRARQARQRAITEAHQGRLFPKGPRVEGYGSTLLDPADVARKSQRYEEHMAKSKREAEFAAEERRREARATADLRRHIFDSLRLASKAGVIVVHRHGLRWNFSPRSAERWRGKAFALDQDAWIEFFLQEREALRDLESDTSEAARVLAAQYASESKARETEEKKAKLAAAKQALPKGYVVEKGRGGYHFTTPKGEMFPGGRRGLKTKGETVTAAIAHHKGPDAFWMSKWK